MATNQQDSMDSKQDKPKAGASRRGFASMDPQRQREIAREGGRASHASGNAHRFTSEEARAAGKKSHGGQARMAETDAAASVKPLTEVIPPVAPSR